MAEYQRGTSGQSSKSFPRPRTDKFSSKSLRALTHKLIQLSESRSKGSAHGSGGELEGTLHHLKSSRLRSSESARVFRENGGLEALLQISSKLHPARESDCKTLAVLWGTVANLCALDNESRSKVNTGNYTATIFVKILLFIASLLQCAVSAPNEMCKFIII